MAKNANCAPWGEALGLQKQHLPCILLDFNLEAKKSAPILTWNGGKGPHCTWKCVGKVAKKTVATSFYLEKSRNRALDITLDLFSRIQC